LDAAGSTTVRQPSRQLAFLVNIKHEEGNYGKPRTKRGRPATGRDPVSAVRLPEHLTQEIDRWAEKYELTRSETIRCLVELGLKAKK
jgi:hypothetical protein